MQVITNEGIERLLSLIIPLGYKIRFYGGEYYNQSYIKDIVHSITVEDLNTYLICEDLVTEYEINNDSITFRASDLTSVSEGYKRISLVGLVDSNNNLISVSRVDGIAIRNDLTSFEYKFTNLVSQRISNIEILGKRTVCNDETGSFIISNYDPLSLYEISCINGSVGQKDSTTLYFIKNPDYNDSTVIIKRNNIPWNLYVSIVEPYHSTPEIYSIPEFNYIGYQNYIRSSEYKTLCHDRLHYSTDQTFTKDSTNQSSFDDTTNLNSILQPFGDTTGVLDVRVRYKNSKNEYTNQSNITDFTISKVKEINYLGVDDKNVVFETGFGYKEYQSLSLYTGNINFYKNGIRERVFPSPGWGYRIKSAVSNDGSCVVIGQKINGVSVYNKKNTGVQEEYIIPNHTNQYTDYFGKGLAVSFNGEWLLVDHEAQPEYQRGSVYAYKLVDGTYSLMQTITPPSPGNYEYFGLGNLTNFNMSQDGVTAVAKRDKTNQTLVVLKRSGNTQNIHQSLGNTYTDMIGVSNCGNFVQQGGQMFVQNNQNYVQDYLFQNEEILAVNTQYCITRDPYNTNIIKIYKRVSSSQTLIESFVLPGNPDLIYFPDPDNSSKVTIAYSLYDTELYIYHKIVFCNIII